MYIVKVYKPSTTTSTHTLKRGTFWVWEHSPTDDFQLTHAQVRELRANNTQLTEELGNALKGARATLVSEMQAELLVSLAYQNV